MFQSYSYLLDITEFDNEKFFQLPNYLITICLEKSLLISNLVNLGASDITK